MVYLHNGILRSREKEGAYTLCNNQRVLVRANQKGQSQRRHATKEADFELCALKVEARAVNQEKQPGFRSLKRQEPTAPRTQRRK